MIAVVGGTVFTPAREIPDGAVLVEGHRVVAVGPRRMVAIPTGAEVIDVQGGYIAPGFMDIHCHGAAGVDFNGADNTIADLRRAAAFKAAHGTTSFLATVATASPAATRRALDLVHRAVGADGGAELLGAQAEGPYFNPDAAGAQAAEHLRRPSLAELDCWLDVCPELRLVSLAPELEGALEYIAGARARGLTLSVGHSHATYDQVMAAVAAGLTHATHLFNAMGGFHHRWLDTAGAVLSRDEITAETILDYIHLHPAAVRIIARVKGPGRMALITDAMPAAGLPEGEHDWDGRRITVRQGLVQLPDGTVAGSVLTMDRGLRNLVSAGIPLGDALTMAAATPARSIGLAHRKGSVACGLDADLVVLNQDLQVQLTMVRGTVVSRTEGNPDAL